MNANPRNPVSGRPRAAFTLIELLAVIGIVGVLAAIIIVVVARARGSAHASQCRSNLRQIYVAATLYSTDNKGYTPTRDYRWCADLWPYAYPNIAYSSSWNPADGLPAKFSNTIFECVVAADDNTDTKRSYGINGNAVDAAKMTARITNVLTPSRTAYFGEVLGSSNLGPTTVNARHNGRMNVVFFDGHVEAVVITAEIRDPAAVKTTPFWSGATK